MVEHPNEKTPTEPASINANSAAELAALAEELGVSPYHLSKVIRRVGPVLGDIYHALGLRPWEIPKREDRANPTDSP